MSARPSARRPESGPGKAADREGADRLLAEGASNKLIARRLEELLLSATETRIDAELTLGRHEEFTLYCAVALANSSE